MFKRLVYRAVAGFVMGAAMTLGTYVVDKHVGKRYAKVERVRNK